MDTTGITTTEGRCTTSVRVTIGGRERTISIYKPSNNPLDGQSEAMVNWSCFGAVTTEEAELFARALMVAIELAKKYTEDFKNLCKKKT